MALGKYLRPPSISVPAMSSSSRLVKFFKGSREPEKRLQIFFLIVSLNQLPNPKFFKLVNLLNGSKLLSKELLLAIRRVSNFSLFKSFKKLRPVSWFRLQ